MICSDINCYNFSYLGSQLKIARHDSAYMRRFDICYRRFFIAWSLPNYCLGNYFSFCPSVTMLFVNFIKINNRASIKVFLKTLPSFQLNICSTPFLKNSTIVCFIGIQVLNVLVIVKMIPSEAISIKRKMYLRVTLSVYVNMIMGMQLMSALCMTASLNT